MSQYSESVYTTQYRRGASALYEINHTESSTASRTVTPPPSAPGPPDSCRPET